MTIVEVLKSPVWWFTAVVIALIVNLISSFLKEPVGNFFAGYSKRFRDLRQGFQRGSQRIVEEVSVDDTKLILLSHRRLRLLMYTIASGVLAFSAASILPSDNQIATATTLMDKLNIGVTIITAIGAGLSLFVGAILLWKIDQLFDKAEALRDKRVKQSPKESEMLAWPNQTKQERLAAMSQSQRDALMRLDEAARDLDK